MDFSSTRAVLTLREIELFDPSAQGLTIGQGRGEQRALCPLCGQGKPRDASHRSLSLNRSSGVWRCHRCGEGGKVKEMWEDRSSFSCREWARRGLEQAFNLGEPIAPCQQVSKPLNPTDNCADISESSPSRESWKHELRSLHPLDTARSGDRGAVIAAR